MEVRSNGPAWRRHHPDHGGVTSPVPGEVEEQDVAAEAAQVVQRLQVLLQLGVGEFTPEDRGQVAKHVGVQGGRPAGPGGGDSG